MVLKDKIRNKLQDILDNALADLPGLGKIDLFDHNFRYITSADLNNDLTAQFIPNDTFIGNQWHLNGANGVNTAPVWNDYTGQGITMGFIDDGVEYTHADLSPNYDGTIDYDSNSGAPDGVHVTISERHGTTTSGVAGAKGNNGQGVAGVAYDADFTSFHVSFGSGISDAQLADLMNRQLQVDVTNNSWSFVSSFSDNFQTWLGGTKAALENAVNNGRGGLGTNIVFSGGNNRESGDNSNYHNMQNSPYTVTVAATDENGQYTYFSTPGAALLTSAPGLNIVSTDRAGGLGYVSGEYVAGLAGTSYAAPIVSGVIALMLEANAALGYRDVQEILAHASRNSDSGDDDWVINGADNSNGGGMHFNENYGFGLVDAHAAVRLAETWDAQSTFNNLQVINSGFQAVNAQIPDNDSITGVASIINIAQDIEIDNVEVDLNIAHNTIGNLVVTLTSPDGTVSNLVNRPGINPDGNSNIGSSANNINFTFTSNAYWGEESAGNWMLTAYDMRAGTIGTLQNWTLRINGDVISSDDTYIYTDEFASATGNRQTLSDTNGGADTINTAATTAGNVISLVQGGNSTIAGNSLSIAVGSTIENVSSGDGDDSITGNSAGNYITTGRGDDVVDAGSGNDFVYGLQGADSLLGGGNNDRLYGGQGNDTQNGNSGNDTIYGDDGDDLISGESGNDYLRGGAGNDTLDGGANRDFLKGEGGDDTFVFSNSNHSALPWNNDVIEDFTQGSDVIDLAAVGVAGINQLTITQSGGSTFIDDDNSNLYIELKGLHNLLGSDFIFNPAAIAGTPLDDTINGTGADDTINANAGNDLVFGAAGNDSIDGGAGNDYIYGDEGADTINGSSGNDTINGGNGDNVVNGGDGNDKFYSGTGNNILNGEAGNDTLYGGSGADEVNGGSGNDYLRGGTGNDTLDGGANRDFLKGEGGADIFVFSNPNHSALPWNNDVIEDFEQGIDLIDVSAIGTITAFGDIVVSNNGSSTFIDDNGSSLHVELTGVFALNSSDFVFI